MDAAERVLLAAELVPPGRVVSYGDIAELVGTSARRAGRVMATRGSAVLFWRVVNHSGDLATPCREAALPQWREEGIELKPNGLGCRMGHYRADLAEWASAYEAALAALDD